MKLHFAMFASYAELAADGRVSMIGGDIDTFLLPHAKSPDFEFATLCLVAKLLVEPADLGRAYTIEVRLVAADDTVIDTIREESVVPNKIKGVSPKLCFVMRFYGTRFLSIGPHTARIYGNGVELGVVPFSIQHAPSEDGQ